jgi:hypothetical protein
MSDTKEVKPKTDDWAEMSDDNEEPEQEEAKDAAPVEKAAKPKKIPAEQKGTKNNRGDYVVTTINIPDMRSGFKKNEDGTDMIDQDDSDTEYDEETDVKETAVVEEAKEGKSYKI